MTEDLLCLSPKPESDICFDDSDGVAKKVNNYLPSEYLANLITLAPI